MSAPNIVNVTTITGKAAFNTPTVVTEVDFIVNPAASGQLWKINQVVASNNNLVAAINATLTLCSDAASPTVSNVYSIIPAVAVPAHASLVCVDKSAAIYLEENQSLRVTTSAVGSTTRANSTAYMLGQIVVPATANGYYYICTVAGTSAATIPTYPTTIGTTVVDGGVTWTTITNNAGITFTASYEIIA